MAFVLLGVVFLLGFIGFVILVVQERQSRISQYTPPPPEPPAAADARNRQTGAAGETNVTRTLLAGLPSGTYEVFTDVRLAARHQREHGVQMDHVVLSIFGIVVVETKTWKGRVSGGRKGPWLQKTEDGQNEVKNPWAQNARQVRRLRTHFDLTLDAVKGVVCFAGNATLSGTMPANIVYQDQLIAHIIATSTREVFDDDSLALLGTRLRALSNPAP